MLDEDDMIINSTQFLWMSKSVSFADSIGSLDDGITYVMACGRHRKICHGMWQAPKGMGSCPAGKDVS
jgi:hypothetical protein